MYQWYQIMLCLLKFDFFFFVGVTMQVRRLGFHCSASMLMSMSLQLLIIVLAKNGAEFGVTISAIPVVLVLLALCGVAVQREIKWYVVTVLSP
jgi:hypothetical protein